MASTSADSTKQLNVDHLRGDYEHPEDFGGGSGKRRRKSDRVSRTTGDEEVLALCKRRINLFTELGPTLRNPSPKDPKRAEKNRANTAARKRIKKELQINCDQMCARVMQLFAAELGQLVP